MPENQILLRSPSRTGDKDVDKALAQQNQDLRRVIQELNARLQRIEDGIPQMRRQQQKVARVAAGEAVDEYSEVDATVTHQEIWNQSEGKWDIRVAWAGNQNLLSVKVEVIVTTLDKDENEVETTTTLDSNNVKDDQIIVTDVANNTPYQVILTGYPAEDQSGEERIIYDVLARTPPTPPDLGQGIKTWQAGGMGFLRYTPPAPARVTRFRVYKTSGMPLKQVVDGNEWEVIMPHATKGYYQTFVELHKKHLSWIRYEIQIDDGASSDIVGEVSFDFDEKPEVNNLWLDWIRISGDVAISWFADEDVKSVVYAWNKTGKDDLNDAAFAASILNGRYINGNARQDVTVAAKIKPGETIYVGLRPFKEELANNTDQTTVTQGPDIYENLYIPTTGELPTWSLEHSKSGSTVTLMLSILSDPALLVTKIQERSSVGRLLTATDMYADITRNAGTSYPHVYQKSVDISTANKHDSYVQFKIVTIAGIDDITLEPFTIDADNHPEALISWSHNWIENTEKWDFRVAWSGDDDLGSIRINVNGTIVNSNNTQGQATIVNNLDSDAAWTLTVTGYTGNNQAGISAIILQQTGKTPPMPDDDMIVVPEDDPTIVKILEQITVLQNLIQEVIDETSNWDSDVVFSNLAPSSSRRHNRIQWAAGDVTYLEETPQAISAGQVDLADSGRTYVYYDPAKPSATLNTSTDFDIAIQGSRFVMCIAWASVSGTNAKFVSAIGTLNEIVDIQANIGAFNLVTTVQLTAAEINAILGVFTGSVLLTDGANLVWGANLVNGMYTAADGAGYIDETGIYFKGGGTDFYKLVPSANSFIIRHGNSDRLIIGAAAGGQGCYNGPFKVSDDLTADDDLNVKGNANIIGGNVEGVNTKPGNLMVAGNAVIAGSLTVGGQNLIDPTTLTVTETVETTYSNEFLGSRITHDPATNTFVLKSFPLGLSELVVLDGSGDGSTAEQFVSVLSASTTGSGLQYKLSDLPVKNIAFSGSGTYITGASLGNDGILTFTRGN